jgi:Glycosyltransferase family 87
VLPADTFPIRRTVLPAALAAAFLAATSRLGTDYPWDAGPAIRSLAHGDLHDLVADQAQMGPLSLLVRAPLAALVGPSSIWAYRLGAFACLLVVLGLAALLARRATPVHAAIAAALLIVNPVAIDALRLGHPEERLGSALCVMALLLARDRQITAGIALGAALATKQWALIAIAPVLLAAPRDARRRLALTAAGVAAAITAPFALAAPHAFVEAMRHPAFGVAEMRTGNVWGWAAITNHISLGGGASVSAYTVPGWLQHGAHLLVAFLTLGLGVAALRARRAIDPLALLTLLMLVRCALDPWDHAYYHAPFLAALIAWEVLRARRAPWLAAACAGFLGLVFRLPLPASDVLYALWALPLGLWLSRRALCSAPVRVRRPLPLPAA